MGAWSRESRASPGGPIYSAGVSITAILPLKALDRSKQRLAARLDATERRALMGRLFTRVAEVCLATPGIDDVRAVVGDGAGGALAASLGIAWTREPRPDLNAAIAHATGLVDSAASLVVVADLPELTVADLRAVVAASGTTPGVVVAPTRDGGTGALLRRPADAVAPAFGPGSAAAHLDAGRRAGLRTALVASAGLAADLDRPADLDGGAGAGAGTGPRSAAAASPGRGPARTPG